MRSTCGHTGCGLPVASNVTGEHWHHLRVPPEPHQAWPAGEPEHTCTRPDPYCPLCELAGVPVKDASVPDRAGRPISSISGLPLDYGFAHRVKASEAYPHRRPSHDHDPDVQSAGTVSGSGAVMAIVMMAATTVAVAAADVAGWNVGSVGAGMMLVSAGVAHGWRDWWRR